MIPEIRSYFKSVINEVDSDLKEHDEYFVSDNIADTNLEDKYFLSFGAMETERQDSNMTANIQVNLSIYKNGYTDIIENLDEAFCKAIEIQLKLMDQSRVDQLDFIKSVVGTLITPEQFEQNGNLAVFNLQFIVTVGYESY